MQGGICFHFKRFCDRTVRSGLWKTSLSLPLLFSPFFPDILGRVRRAPDEDKKKKKDKKKNKEPKDPKATKKPKTDKKGKKKDKKTTTTTLPPTTTSEKRILSLEPASLITWI